MTIQRTKSPDWAANEVLTSDQMNAVDTNITHALDKRSGQSDTLGSTITMTSGSGFLVGSGASLQFDSDSGFIVGTGTTFIVASSAAFSGTISFTNTVTHSGNTNFNLNTSFGVLGTETHNGAANFTSTSVLTHKASSSEVYETGASINFGSGAGATVSGNITTSGTLVMWGTYGIASTALLSVAGSTVFGSSSTITFTSGMTVAGTLTTSGTLLMNGTYSIQSGANFLVSGNVLFSSSSTINSSSDIILSSVTDANITFSTPRTFTRVVQSAPSWYGSWSASPNSGVVYSNAVGGNVFWYLDLPHGSTITDYAIFIQPGIHVVLPANMPAARLIELNISTGTVTNYGVVTDSSANIVDYGIKHSISPSTFSCPVDNTDERYILQFDDEYGASSVSGQSVYGATVTYTTPGIDSAR